MVNNKPILENLKVSLGIYDDESFDTEIVIFANGAILELKQVGCLSKDSNIESTTTISDIIDDKFGGNSNIASYMYQYILLYVKILFDPPTANTANIMSNKMKEMLWRLDSECTRIENQPTT